MTLSGRPLLGARDLELFTGRAAELDRAVAGLRRGLNCVVTGQPGMGRTTFARAALLRLGDPEVTVRVRGAPDAAAILTAIEAELGHAGLIDGRPNPASGRAGPLEAIDRIARRVAEAAVGPVLLVEDVAGQAGLELFGAYRDELWAIGLRWLVTVSEAAAATVLQPPADVFFEVRVDLEPLPDAQARELILRRLAGDRSAAPDPDPAALDRVVAIAGGNPRRLIDLTRELLTDPEAADRTADSIARRDAALAALSRSARLLAAELDSLGSAAASDEAVLNRMGWTRARAVQVFAELERAGLVTYRNEATGRGRPRKVYRPAVPPI